MVNFVRDPVTDADNRYKAHIATYAYTDSQLDYVYVVMTINAKRFNSFLLFPFLLKRYSMFGKSRMG